MLTGQKRAKVSQCSEGRKSEHGSRAQDSVLGGRRQKEALKFYARNFFVGMRGAEGGGELANYVVISSSVCHRMCFSFVWEGATGGVRPRYSSFLLFPS